MYNLIIKKSARKELDNIPNPFFLKIDEAILALKNNPYPCLETCREELREVLEEWILT